MKKNILLLTIMSVSVLFALTNPNLSSVDKLESKNNFESTDNILIFSKKVKFGVSESDAEIFVNGRSVAKGSTTIVIDRNDCVTVVVKKVGFLTEKIELCNKKNMPKAPKSLYIEMKRDDAYDASVQTDIANVDIELKCDRVRMNKAWGLINKIILNYIDVIEMTDKETGYLRTAWSLKTFKQNTVRTRIVVKKSSDKPLIFKIKLISEASGLPKTSVKSDELYREWDRVLRSYSDVIGEFQARLK